jgi:hypothetical protein
MGSNVSKTVQKVQSSITNEIESNATASATTNCTTDVGDIYMSGDSINLELKNYCNASAKVSMAAAVNAAMEALANATTEQKSSILPGLNASSTDQETKTLIEAKINQNCNTDAKVTSVIKAGKITLEKLKNSNLMIINTGDAKGTCGISTVIDTISKAGTTSKTSQASEQLADILKALTGGPFMIVVICVLVVVMVFLFLRK